MNLIRIFKNKIEIKRLKQEEIDLDGFFMNRCEAMAALGEDYEEYENIKEMSERFNYVSNRIDQLEAINKRGWFKWFLK